jgi:hypothetical protein
VKIGIIDMTTPKSAIVMVHTYAAPRGYQTFVHGDQIERKIKLGVSYAEFMVWDELEAEAYTVEVGDLMQAGLRACIPELQELPEDYLPSHPPPRYRPPRSCVILSTSSRRLELRRDAQEKIQRSILADKHHLGYKDKRFPMEGCTMARYLRVCECIGEPKFQLVFLVAILAISTRTYEQSSMLENLVRVVRGLSSIPSQFLRV